MIVGSGGINIPGLANPVTLRHGSSDFEDLDPVSQLVPNVKGAVIERDLARCWGYRSPDGRLALRRAVSRGLARSASAHLRGGRLGLDCAAALHANPTDPLTLLELTVLTLRLICCMMQRGSRG